MYSLSFMPPILPARVTMCNGDSTILLSALAIHKTAAKGLNLGMDLFAIRRDRLQAIIDADFDGSQASFCRLTKFSTPQVSRWLSTTNSDSRNITEPSARKIERVCNKPPMWLDSYNPMPLLSPQAIKLAEIVSAMPEQQQAGLIHLVETAIEMQRQAALVTPS